MKCKLDVDGRISEPHGELQRPRSTVVVDYTVDIDVANVPGSYKTFFQRLENLIGELTGADQPHYRARFSAIRPDSTGEKSFLLEIFFPPGRESARADPGADRELDPLDPVL